jgi:diguanylate cyclase (GGDEF)-like protein
MDLRHVNRSKLLAPVVGLVLTIAAIAGVALLVGRADSSREAQLQSNSLTLSLANLRTAPFNVDPAAGGSATAIRTTIQTYEGSISRGLTVRSNAGVAPALLAAGRADLAKIEPFVTSIYLISLNKGGLAGAGSRVPKLNEALTVRAAALSGLLAKISRTDGARAERAGTQAKLGAAGAMLLLLAAFVYFYLRSVASHKAVERLAREKGYEARTDALTKLGNRRALTSDLAGAIAEPSGSDELLLVMFDLDGFKQYNDTFGHTAGDALLQRLCDRLAAAAREHSGSAYRMGGDEFCTLARSSPDNAERLLDDTIAALQDGGEGWHIGCSQGAAWIPSEAGTENQALNLADERMYANKTGRSSAGRQVTDALLQVVTEQNVALDDHVERVAELCSAVAQALGQPAHEVRLIHLTARLHDIGKTAIPAAILDKPGPLDEQEWEFMRRHPPIGERIVMAAPALANCAPLIRSSHERIDGQGYPDGLTGQDIPLGSRIIAVCDAFDAMTSDRLYRPAMSTEAALEQLKRNAGTQFDATIVKAFCTVNSLPRSSNREPRVSNPHDPVTRAIMPTTHNASAHES